MIPQKSKSQITIDALKAFVITWNNKFPFDKLFRKKYGIPFNSEQHRQLSQIDVYMEILEDKLIENHFIKQQKQKELFDSYKETGEFLIDLDDKWSEEEKEDVFDKFMESIKKMNEK